MTDVKNRRGGFYWLDNKPYVSVTNVIEVLDKGNQLMYWFGKQVFYAAIKNPNISEKEALRAPYDTLDKAADRGSTIHSIVESWKQTKEYIETIPTPYKGYADAFYSWLKDNKVEILENEKTVVSKKNGFAGTADIIGKVNGKLYVIDIKTNKNGAIYETYHLQVSAYIEALRENGVAVEGGYVLVLSPEGKYTYGQITECFDVFLKLRDVWVWKNQEKCNKVGYSI